jgi:hypothetical protein
MPNRLDPQCLPPQDSPDNRAFEISGRKPSYSLMAPAHPRRKLALRIGTVLLIGYGILAYLVLPATWTHYEHQKKLAGVTMVTLTAQGIQGDPINFGLVGAKEDVICAMHAAAWYPADPITLRSSFEIIGSVVLHRAYPDAPVSNLFYDNRREDLAFEKADGRSASRRHHVRFWKVLDLGDEGRPVWLGAATFDRGVGFSHYTAQVTHHIAPNIDAERDHLTGDLKTAKVVEAIYQVSGIGPTLIGRNGEGDQYYTDGEVEISRLVAGCNSKTEGAVELDNPPMTNLKNLAWKAAASLLQGSDAPTNGNSKSD